MATYASTSNPFIKTKSDSKEKNDSTNNGFERGYRKEAPGMAKPQSLLDEIRRQKEANLLLSHDDSGFSSEKMDTTASLDTLNSSNLLDKNMNEREAESCCKVSSEKVEEKGAPSNGIEPCSLSDTDEISKACESLVEAAIRLELEETSVKIDQRNKHTKHEENTSSTTNDQALFFEKLDKNDNVGDVKQDHDDDDDGEEDEIEIELDDDHAPMEKDSRQHQHTELIKKLRLQLRDLEKYAYERGELDQVPASVLAERQTVILDTLKDKLSLSIGVDEIKKLELDELKKQVNKEINDLIDPLITKEHLLNQLKTQLTDLERYITHLHRTLGKIHEKKSCSCSLHGCSSQDNDHNLSQENPSANLAKEESLMSSDALPKTSRLIRGLVTQLICSDIKLRESAKKEEQELSNQRDNSLVKVPVTSVKRHNDAAAWTLHIDKVILATDSLVNLFTTEPQYQRSNDKSIDEGLVESIVRRQLVPAIKDLLTYGLIDLNSMPNSTSYASLLFDPYYLLASLTCFPSSEKQSTSAEKGALGERLHVWTVIEDYYKYRNEPGFKTSSVKTLSQSFNLGPSISGPIKITSKQALLIAVEDIIETLSKCKPNGPESHFRAFIYTALNRSRLSTWLRLIFRNKSVIRKYYHNFCFVGQNDKMDKFFKTIEALNQIEFKLRTDVESIEQFVSAF